MVVRVCFAVDDHSCETCLLRSPLSSAHARRVWPGQSRDIDSGDIPGHYNAARQTARGTPVTKSADGKLRKERFVSAAVRDPWQRTSYQKA